MVFIKWATFLTLSLLVQACFGEILSGRYRGSNTWVYLGGFGFRNDEGTVETEFLLPDVVKTTLAVYFLDSDSKSLQDGMAAWEETLSGSLTCQEKMRRADLLIGLGTNQPEVVKLEEIRQSGLFQVSTKQLVSSMGGARHIAIAVGNCAGNCSNGFCSSGLSLSWSIKFWSENLNHPYLNIGEIKTYRYQLAFLILYLGLGFFAIKVARSLVLKRKYHATVHIAMVSVLFIFLSLVTGLFDLSSRGRSGSNPGVLYYFALFSVQIAEWLNLVLAILLAKGWTITCRKLSAKSRTKIYAYMFSYCILSTLCLTSKPLTSFQGSYFFDTPGGKVLIVLRVVAFGWFARCLHRNIQKYARKRMFYKKLFVVYFFWFLTPVLAALLLRGVEDPYKGLWYDVVVLMCTFLLHLLLLLLYDPRGYFIESFPFHATITLMFIRNSSGQDDKSQKIRKAVQMNNMVKYGTSLFARYTSDLLTFLEELNPDTENLIYNDEDLPETKVQNWVR